MDWLVENLRVSVFKLRPSTEIREGLWQRIRGESPDVVVARAKEGIHIEQGTYRSGVLIVQDAPTRTDMVYQSPPPLTEEGLFAFPTAGRYEEEVGPFIDAASEWLGECAPGKRIAFGAVLLLPVVSRSEGYRVILSLVPNLPIDPEESSDLVFQTNHAVVSQVSGDLMLNRLRHYAVAQLVVAPLPVGLQLVGKPVSATASRLSLDFSSDAAWEKEIDRPTLKAVLRELVELARRYLEPHSGS